MKDAALVIAEHNQTELHPATFSAVTAATQLTSNITLLIAGYDCQAVATQASHLQGVQKVLFTDAPFYANPTAEDLSSLVLSIVTHYTYIITPATAFGKNFLPRVAAMCDVAQISDVVKILSPNTFIRPIYAGNAYQTIESHDKCYVLTIRSTAFKPATLGHQTATIESLTPVAQNTQVAFVSEQQTSSARPDLSQARIIVAGGRGLQSKENFKFIEQLADKLGSAVGASRAAVDAGFISNDHQIGQTGKIVAPDLYIAIGISGAIQHIAGMKGSKVIVAINKDANAPIFQIADYGLVGDLFKIIPELCQALD